MRALRSKQPRISHCFDLFLICLDLNSYLYSFKSISEFGKQLRLTGSACINKVSTYPSISLISDLSKYVQHVNKTHFRPES